ncbi:response regulator [Streptosporangium subroseum]|uniref:response regulator n=1 Tax=Streptosporangium subroseum TaxID=106412 RepID=UPI00342BF44D
MAIRCVIVDDSDHFRVAARELLEREGIRVVGLASTTADALQRVSESRPDVTLVDIDLGEESGFDLARQLADAGHTDPPNVILISTYTEKDLRELIAVSPAIAFLPKSSLSGTAIREILGGACEEGHRDRG